MSIPYEPVVRHAHSHGDVVCTPCHYEQPAGPCPNKWCACTCRDLPVQVTETEQEGEAPQQEIVPPQHDWTQGWRPIITLPDPPPPRKSKVKEFIARWELPWAILTVLIYLVTVILVVVVFPDVSNLWVSVFVLVSGFTGSLTALASVLKTKE